MTNLGQPLINCHYIIDRVDRRIAVAKLRVGERLVLGKLIVEDLPEPARLGLPTEVGHLTMPTHGGGQVVHEKSWRVQRRSGLIGTQ